MNTPHTPEKWTVGLANKFGVNNANMIYDADGAGIACVYGIASNRALDELTARDAEGLRKAHMIAAAPDLLAALESVLDNMGALCNRSELENAMGIDDAAKVFAAIAKAKGQP